MISWIRLYRSSTNSYLSIELNVPVSNLDIAERWAQWRYPSWTVLSGESQPIIQDHA